MCFDIYIQFLNWDKVPPIVYALTIIMVKNMNTMLYKNFFLPIILSIDMLSVFFSHVYFLGQVNAGLECGIGMEDYDNWEEGDIIEAFNSVQKKRTLEEASASMAAALEEVGIGV